MSGKQAGVVMGTVVDYAYETFKEVNPRFCIYYSILCCCIHSMQDKRLSQLRYMALTKSERVRYKATKKLIHYLVCLLRMRAVVHLEGM